MIVSILLVSSLNYSFGQFNNFVNKFKKCSLPFSVNDETFDMCHSDGDRVVISEENFIKYLAIENDTFLNLKESPLEKTGYHKYLAVCKFDVYNDYLGLLYFRRINSDKGNNILELILCIFTKKGKLISTYPISGYYTAENKQFYSTIFNEENIEILFYDLNTYDFIDENVKEKKHLYITKEGVIKQK